MRIKNLLFTILLVFSSVIAAAQQFKVNGITYQVQTTSTCRVVEPSVYVDFHWERGRYLGQRAVIPSTVTYRNRRYTVTEIGNSAFSSSPNLSSVVIPNTVTEIGAWAFAGCKRLTSIVIPSSVKGIDQDAFSNCPLRSVTVKATTPPNIHNYQVFYTEKTATLYVPRNSLNLYGRDYDWGRFQNIVAIENHSLKYVAEAPEVSNKVADAVDLGLSVCWASCNVGASSPEDMGGHYAWGETETKVKYKNDNYSLFERTFSSSIEGTTYDVAHVKWGDRWRMPTESEVEELMDKCTWVKEVKNGQGGYTITGPNGKSIFLPKENLVNYWASTPCDQFYAVSWIGGNLGQQWRSEGNVVRAVCPSNASTSETRVLPAKKVDSNGWVSAGVVYNGGGNSNHESTSDEKMDYTITAVDLGLSVKWADKNIGAKSIDDKGICFGWGQTTPYDNEKKHSLDRYISDRTSNDISGTRYDAAYVYTKGKGRMPTREEAYELLHKCTWKREGGKWIVTGPNGNHICFADTYSYMEGEGSCVTIVSDFMLWTSTLDSSGVVYVFDNTGIGRMPECIGTPIRAVCR